MRPRRKYGSQRVSVQAEQVNHRVRKSEPCQGLTPAKFASCRDRRGELYNSEATKRTGKMLAAGFVHETSRAKDPDLHMHVLVANVTIDGDRNEALAMSYGEMLEMRRP